MTLRYGYGCDKVAQPGLHHTKSLTVMNNGGNFVCGNKSELITRNLLTKTRRNLWHNFVLSHSDSRKRLDGHLSSILVKWPTTMRREQWRHLHSPLGSVPLPDAPHSLLCCPADVCHGSPPLRDGARIWPIWLTGTNNCQEGSQGTQKSVPDFN